MTRVLRSIAALTGIMGTAGVALAALAAHQPDAAHLVAASTLLLMHATAALGAVALADRGLLHGGIGTVAAGGFVLGALLFATDITLRQFTGHRLFPMAAPTGGTLLILSWLLLTVAAGWPRRLS